MKANMIVVRNHGCYLATVKIDETMYYVDFDCVKPIGYRSPERAFNLWFEKHKEFERGEYSDSEVSDALFDVAIKGINNMLKHTLPEAKK